MPPKASMTPPFHFTTPVLSVAADAVRELQGGDALSSLWTLFTKCKESLHDGRRLENISWRLWYREMATTSRRGDKDDGYLNEKVDERITTGDDKPRRGSFVGRIIVDMLPNNLVQQHPSSFGGVPVSTASRPTHCQLPTPATSDDNPSALPTPATEHEPISPHLPSIQLFLDATPPPPPRVVVVNPTPGPTPHPTPPTTPILGALLPNGNRIGNGNEVRRFGDKLLPLPMPMPVLGIQVPTIPISGSSGSSSGRTAVSSSPGSSKSGSGSLSSRTNPDVPISPITAFTPTTTTDIEMGKNSGPGPSTRTRPGHMRRTSSASSSGRVTTNTAGTKDKSRSRSRDAAGLVMSSTKRGGKIRVGAVRRTSSGRAGGTAGGSAVVMRRTASNKAAERKPTFNIGSNSDEGSATASKSARSASPGSRMGVQTVPEEPPPSPPQPPASRVSPPFLLPPVPPTLSSQHPLPHPSAVIPQLQQRRTMIVLATSESDYETESESESEDRSRGDAEGGVGKDDEDADWSSEEDVSTGDVDVVVRRDAPATRPHTNLQEDRHQLQLPTVPAAITTTRTTSQAQVRPSTQNQHPTRGHPHPPLTRAQQQRQVQAARAAHVVEQAALEAERQREMFTKKHVPSAEELLGKRTRSVGLLSQLMNPDPQIFPVNHPYRRGFSSGEIRGGMGMTKTTVGASRVVGVNGKESGERREPGGAATPLIAPGMRTNKSSAAIPVASQVQVGSAVSGGSGMKNGIGSGGYRPKGRPAGQEMEDDSDSDGDGEAQNTMLLSKSVAQEKLKALAAKRGIVAHQQLEKRDVIEEEEDPVPRWVRERSSAGQSNGRVTNAGVAATAAAIPRQQHPTPNMIPVGHPYNLPPPTAPSTPRTTRRLMLQTEMSESLRRNLLWERQVSKVNLAGVRRTASASGQNVLGGVKPLTMAPSIVQLTAKKAGAARGEVHGPAGPPDGRVEGPEEKEERRRQALARNRSWAADDYHYNGW